MENELELQEEVIEDSISYKVHLDNFDGPLDLLLHLIKEAKMEIQDIKLSEITGQYLNFLNEIDNLDMTLAAEFIEIAAILIEIKSKALLPRESEEEIDEEDPERKLLRRIKEYQLFKEASESLKEIEDVNKFYKVPEPSASDFRVVLKQMNMDNLISAFTKLMEKAFLKAETYTPKTIERDRWTLEEKIFEIKATLTKSKKVSFSKLVEDDYTIGEIVTLFMALLELLKVQFMTIKQDNMFGEIEIEYNEEFKDEE